MKMQLNSIKKTHKNNKSYTTSNLIKVSGEASVLGRLYTLKVADEDESVKLAIVSNVPYNSVPNGKLISEFVSLFEEEKGILKDSTSIKNGISILIIMVWQRVV